jgi:predicted metal-dependent enzyme (double-stranded beta helix superfamily)
MKRPPEVYPAAWPGSKSIGIENVALSPGVFRYYHHRIVGVESESVFRGAEQRECCEVDTEDGREPEASAG